MKKGDKIVCIDDRFQFNNFTILNRLSLGKIYKIRGFSCAGGIMVDEFIHGYHKDGNEAGFDPKRFIKLSKMSQSKF